MTFTFTHFEINNVYIHIDQEKFENCYHVRAARILSDGTCGHYITDLTYPTEKKAHARFNIKEDPTAVISFLLDTIEDM